MNVLITFPILENTLTDLKSCSIDSKVIIPRDYEHFLKLAKQFDGVICSLKDQVNHIFLETNKHLKGISNYAVGLNNIDCIKAKELDIQIGHTPNVLNEATAELALTLTLCCSRKVKSALSFVESGQWKEWMPQGFLGKQIVGSTVGILGLGRIGTAYARKMEKAFNCNIIYHNRNESASSQYEYVSFEELLKRSDILSVHAPLNDQTKGLFNTNVFRKMKKDSIFINTGRGEIHIEEDLYSVMKMNHLHSAGLDVTNPEPMKSTSPLLTLDNCLVLPHIGSATYKARFDMADICVRNIKAALSNRPMPYPAW